jgi:hypothetical protein
MTPAEIQKPVDGWLLDRIMRRRSILAPEDYWEVALIRERDGKLVSAIKTSLGAAWFSAIADAHKADGL